jgi:hypothetical protein
LDDVKNIFDEYHVIQLREVGISKNLLLGCGNDPVDPIYANRDHNHDGMETINPELSMNPHVVAAFGIDEGLNCLLPKRHYENLYGEAITLDVKLADFMKKETAKEALECLTRDFNTFEIGEEGSVTFGNSAFF